MLYYEKYTTKMMDYFEVKNHSTDGILQSCDIMYGRTITDSELHQTFLYHANGALSSQTTYDGPYSTSHYYDSNGKFLLYTRTIGDDENIGDNRRFWSNRIIYKYYYDHNRCATISWNTRALIIQYKSNLKRIVAEKSIARLGVLLNLADYDLIIFSFLQHVPDYTSDKYSICKQLATIVKGQSEKDYVVMAKQIIVVESYS